MTPCCGLVVATVVGEIVVSGAWSHRTNVRDNVSQLVYLVVHMTYCCLLLLVFLSIYYMLCACIYRYVPQIQENIWLHDSPN